MMLLPAVLEENHHLLIPGIILLQHTLLQHKPVSKEIKMNQTALHAILVFKLLLFVKNKSETFV